MSFEVTLPDGFVVRRLMFDEDFQEYQRLVEMIPGGGTLMEIGVYLGGSLASLAPVILRKGLKVIAVDVFDKADYNEPHVMEDKKNMRARFDAVMAHVGIKPIVIDRSFQLAYQSIKDAELVGHVDLAFIDANHEAKWVDEDIILSLSVVRRGGNIAGHDYDEIHPGVVETVNNYFGGCVKKGGNCVWSYRT